MHTYTYTIIQTSTPKPWGKTKSKTSASIDEQPVTPKTVNYDVDTGQGEKPLKIEGNISSFDDQPIRPKVVNYDLDTDVPFTSSTPKSKMKPKGVSTFEENPIKPINTDKEAPISSKSKNAKNVVEGLDLESIPKAGEYIHICISFKYVYVNIYVFI
jgi:hypothetical protein